MGLTLFASHNPDLVILDLGLPDRDGLEFIRTVRQKYMTPIVVLSARTDEMDKIEALDLGANDYITKPFSTGELLARVLGKERHDVVFGLGQLDLLLVHEHLTAVIVDAHSLCAELTRRGIAAVHGTVAVPVSYTHLTLPTT